MDVVLTPEEILSAVIVGARRLIVSQKAGLTPSAGASRGWDMEIEGAMAEATLAKTLGLYFDPTVGKYGSKDVGPYHVRHTKLKDGSLILRPNDPDGIYVLITGELGTYRIAGYVHSKDAKREEYLKAPNGRPAAYFVPQSALKDKP